MTDRLKMPAFQTALLAVGVLMMVPLPVMTRAAAAPAPAPAAVQIGNFTFRAPIVTVKAGTTIIWTNGDDIPHTVVSRDGLFKSKVLDSGDHFSFTFSKPGQFGYFCSLHPHMTGMIIVTA